MSLARFTLDHGARALGRPRAKERREVLMKGIRIAVVGLVASLFLALMPETAWAYTESYRGDCNSGYTLSARVRGDDMTLATAWGDWVNGSDDGSTYNYVSSGLNYHFGSLGYASAYSYRRYDGGGDAWTAYADWGDKLYTKAGCFFTGT
ncbi:MAG: hypothetical protein ACE5F5_08690 [Acidimicrobiia bacterium]